SLKGLEDPNPPTYKRVLHSGRQMRESGTNDYAFFSDAIDSFLPDIGFFQSQSGENPAASFLGKGKWTETTVDGDFSPGAPVALLATVDHHWAGWSMSKSSLFKIFDQLDSRTQRINSGAPVINRDVFQDMKDLQLYDVEAVTQVYRNGVD